MTKSKKVSQIQKKKKNTPRPQARGPTPYQRLLMDPCNGPVHSVYSGESGIVQRFVQDFTANDDAGTTTRTAGYIVFCPAANQGVRWYANTSATNGSPTAFSGPGASFLATNARKMRSVASCVTVIPSAVSYTNMTGEIAMANVAYNTIEAGGTYNVDSVFQLTNARTVMAKRSYEAKWYPQLLDGTYGPQSGIGTVSLSDPSDHNAILIAYRGFPAGVPLSIRITTIIEWTPGPGLGLAVTTAPRTPVNYLGESSAIHNAKPSWWHNLMEDVGSHVAGELGKGVKFLTSMGVQQGVKYAVSSFPMLTL